MGWRWGGIERELRLMRSFVGLIGKSPAQGRTSCSQMNAFAHQTNDCEIGFQYIPSPCPTSSYSPEYPDHPPSSQ